MPVYVVFAQVQTIISFESMCSTLQGKLITTLRMLKVFMAEWILKYIKLTQTYDRKNKTIRKDVPKIDTPVLGTFSQF